MDIERAKYLLDDYCQREFGSDCDYTDLTDVGVAYTTSEDEKHEFQVSLNLIDCEMNLYVDGFCFTTRCMSAEHMEEMLTWYSFANYIGEAEEAYENWLADQGMTY